MIYDEEIKMNSDRKLVECPRCHNTEFSKEAAFCKICGLPLYNLCGDYDINGMCIGAGHKNVANARYCEICGERTAFFHLGILKPYTDYSTSKNKNDNEDDMDIPF